MNLAEGACYATLHFIDHKHSKGQAPRPPYQQGDPVLTRVKKVILRPGAFRPCLTAGLALSSSPQQNTNGLSGASLAVFEEYFHDKPPNRG